MMHLKIKLKYKSKDKSNRLNANYMTNFLIIIKVKVEAMCHNLCFEVVLYNNKIIQQKMKENITLQKNLNKNT